MTSRRRNLIVLAVVALVLAGAAAVIATKPTRLGLDLQGGVELVYEAKPSPQVPNVDAQAVDDAIETIRKRTDALGVSEPEIQSAGSDPPQISIALPNVQNAARAEEQVGTTAKLQFYDWEINRIVEDQNRVTTLYQAATESTDPNTVARVSRPLPLLTAVELAGKAEPKAEPEDIPPGEEISEQEADRKNDTAQGDKYYLFGPGTGASAKLLAGPDVSCEELLADFEPRPGTEVGERTFAKNTECGEELDRLGTSGPPEGSRVLKVPRGIVVIQNERPDNVPQEAPFNQWYVLEDDSELSGADIKNPEQNFDQRTSEPIVTFEFTDKGRRAFARVTKRIAERGFESQVFLGQGDAAVQTFAITLDNILVSNASVDFRENPEGIDGRTGAQINGIGSLEDTQDLAKNLRIGALPVDLELISKTQVSSTLGKQALDQGLVAGIAGILLTLGFLLVFYRVLGLIAGVALVTYAVLLFALVKLIPITLTLPGIAGLVLTLGVAADANIVIYERIKEEAREGRSIPGAIAAGYSKALKTIVDANVVTIGVAFILFMLATAGVKGFAFTLGIGTLTSLFTAVLATSAILGTMARSRVLRSKWALGVGKRSKPLRFDYMGKSRWFFSASGLILLVCALAISGKGIDFGIDFESGTRIKTPIVQQDASVEDVRRSVEPLGLGDAKIQEVDEPDLGANVFQISTETLEPTEVEEVREKLDSDLGVTRADFSSSSIGPTFGEQIARTAVIAIIASLFLISIYIGLRFEFKFAVPVLIALVHDILITAGVYALVGREVSSATVAALLTILGFSLYDTIIVFDRIRENVPRMPRATFSQIVNRSMSEVIVRSFVTSVSTLFPVAALLLFGGETLRDFAFALLVGVASGTYSSIFIAAPVLTEWKERERVYRRRRRVVMDDHGGFVPAYAEASLGDADGDGAPDRPPRPSRAGARQRRRDGVRSAAAPPPVPDEHVEAVGADVEPEPEPELVPEEPAEPETPPPAPAEPAGVSGGRSKPPKAKRQKPKRKHGRR